MSFIKQNNSVGAGGGGGNCVHHTPNSNILISFTSGKDAAEEREKLEKELQTARAQLHHLQQHENRWACGEYHVNGDSAHSPVIKGIESDVSLCTNDSIQHFLTDRTQFSPVMTTMLSCTLLLILSFICIVY